MQTIEYADNLDEALARDLAGRIASFKLMAPSSPH